MKDFLSFVESKPNTEAVFKVGQPVTQFDPVAQWIKGKAPFRLVSTVPVYTFLYALTPKEGLKEGVLPDNQKFAKLIRMVDDCHMDSVKMRKTLTWGKVKKMVTEVFRETTHEF